MIEEHQPGPQLSVVAACTLAAAHRRDHAHSPTTAPCRPHAVEVVHLGGDAVMLCHDCRYDSGFLAHREAEHLASEHQLLTTLATVLVQAEAEITPTSAEAADGHHQRVNGRRRGAGAMIDL